MKDLLDEYLRYCDRQKGLSPRTLSSYRDACQHWLLWREQDGGRPATLADWTTENAQAWLTAQKRAELHQSTRRVRVASLRNWGAWLLETGKVTSNPWATMKTPVHEQQRQPCPTIEQVRALFDACDRMPVKRRGKMAKAALAFTALAGLRLSEMLAVKVSDLVLSGERASVMVTHGKGGKRRSVPLNSLAVAILSEWLAVRWTATGIENVLFLSGVTLGERPYTDHAFNDLLKSLKCIGRIEEADITAHALRRFAATSLAQQPGASIADAARFLGHANMQTTLRYLRPNNDLHRLAEGILSVPTPNLAPVALVVPVPPAPAAPVPAADNRERAGSSKGKRAPSWRRA